MVDSVLDPMRVPCITLSQTEIDEIQQLIADGQLAPDYLDRHLEAVKKNVFGHDHKLDAAGTPIEQGRGSKFNQTQQSIEAYKKYGHDEPNFAENLKRMEAELAASNKRRAAADASSAKAFRY
jgi:hypothetical protein